MSKSENCIFKNINMINQNFNHDMFEALMFNLYKNIMFSTFPYITYKKSTSLSSLHCFNSGNCIAMCHFIKIYLKRNFNITSFIIPASVPRDCKVIGTPHLSHCAILIPISLHEFCIFDGSLFFMEPMYCNLKDNKTRTIKLSSIYEHTLLDVQYVIRDCKENIRLDTQFNQTIIKNSLCIHCNYANDRSDVWNYYLNEIQNPDDNIGYSYILNKPQPFLLYTEYDKCKCNLKYKILLEEDGNIRVKKYPGGKTVFYGNTFEFKNNTLSKPFKRYLSRDMIV